MDKKIERELFVIRNPQSAPRLRSGLQSNQVLSPSKDAIRNRLSVWMATAGGLGFIPRYPGTATSFVTALVWFATGGSWTWTGGLALLSIGIGFWAVPLAEAALDKKDPNCVVLDEVAGMALSLMGLPFGWVTGVLGFIGFRVFDIWKPYPIRQIQVWPGAWGVMADDVLAAIYSQVCARGCLYVLGVLGGFHD